MIRQDLHVHTTYCDGRHTPEQLVQAALARGMTRLGFSGHSYTPFDPGYCMSPEKEEAYRREIAGLKEKYRGRIELLCGIEQDVYSRSPAAGYDYVIGSVHYVKAGETYIPVDNTVAALREGADAHFGGDLMALIEAYYRTVATVAEVTGATIIGHFDLVTKFNENGKLFDEGDPRYIAAWRAAADRLLTAGIPFEINTGAIARGYRTRPYPAPPILRYLREKGAAFILSGDCHNADHLWYEFDRWEPLLTGDL